MAGFLWPFPPPHSASPNKVPTIDAKGVLNLQAGAGLLTEHRRHAQHVFKGEHIVVGEHPADSVSEGIDLWWGWGWGWGDEVCQGQGAAAPSLSHLAACHGLR